MLEHVLNNRRIDIERVVNNKRANSQQVSLSQLNEMNNEVFVRDNESVRCNEKLYLDSKTADVEFVFTTDTDRIPAHKCILSIVSPVFDAMFYGSMIEEGDILIVDASASAFKEFLQFFYLSKVQLTSENIGVVTNLCNKYELPDALKVCEMPLQMSLKNSDLCWGFEIADFFELEELKRFCVHKIQENPHEILASDSFLECSRKSLDQILQLVDAEGGALEIINACTEWAKAECERNSLETSSVNLRVSLGDSFNRFDFNNISMEEFFKYASKYVGILLDEEIDTITRTIASKKFQLSPFANVPPSTMSKMHCDRRGSQNLEEINYGFTCFVPSKTLLLTEFYLPQLTAKDTTLEMYYSIHGPYGLLHGELAFFRRVTLSSDKETHVVLPSPFITEVGKAYGISVIQTDFEYYKDFACQQVKPLLADVQLADGIDVKFIPGSELIARLIFLKPNE